MAYETFPDARTHNPNWAVAPGEIILECLESRDKTQAWLAAKMKRPAEQVNRLIKGKIGLRPETALQLERVLKRPAIYWLNLESIYRLHLARKKAKR